MVDGGAPQISLAQAEFEQLATFWQEQANFAAAKARHYAMLGNGLHQAYRHAIAESIKSP